MDSQCPEWIRLDKSIQGFANDILLFLRDQSPGSAVTVKFYELLSLFSQWSGDNFSDIALVALYQKQFILMSSLYRLKRSLLADIPCDVGSNHDLSYTLEFDLVSVTLMPQHLSDPSNKDLHDKKVTPGNAIIMEAYYNDFKHFFDADIDNINTLLSEFWKKFSALNSADSIASDLAYLALPTDATWADIKKAYQRKANELHPDKGGDSEAFIALQIVFERLKACHPRS